MRRHWRPQTVALLLLALLMGRGHAAGFTALDLDARIAAADRIVVGIVDDLRVEERAGEPWSLVTLRVERWFVFGGEVVAPEDGVERPETIEVAFWGGSLPNGSFVQVAGMPSFALGERVLWMLRASTPGLAAASVGVSQGVWRAAVGGWRGDDGGMLSLDEEGLLILTGPGAPDELVFEALEGRIAEVLE